MASRQITCINTDGNDPTPGHITYVGGSWGRTPRMSAVTEIRSGIHSYYTVDRYGNRATVYAVQQSNGNWYVTTSRDGSTDNNLLSLPNC